MAKAQPTKKPAAKPAKAAAPASSSKSSAAAARAPKPAATKASKPAAKAAAKPAKPTKSAKPAPKAVKPAKPTKSAKPAPKAVKATKSPPSPLDAVRPLVRVRQMRAFSGRRVTRAELDAINQAARWTGSSRNEQVWRFITLRDQDTIQRIAEMGMPQTRGLPTAPAAIAIVVPDEPERAVSRAFDQGRAAERILIAANLLGLGGGVSRIRKDVRDAIDELLGLPPGRSVRTIVAIGHPTKEALEPKSAPGQARLPREQVIYEERWRSSE